MSHEDTMTYMREERKGALAEITTPHAGTPFKSKSVPGGRAPPKSPLVGALLDSSLDKGGLMV